MTFSFKILRFYAYVLLLLDIIFKIVAFLLLISPLLLLINIRTFNIILSIIILIILIYFLNYFCIWYLINYLYLKREPVFHEYKIESNYIGIVVTTSNLQFWKFLAIFTGGMILLIKYFKEKNLHYKLLTNFDGPFNTKKFREMVYDRNCRELYISGHGRKHRLQISKKQNLYYFLHSCAPKKDKVIQLHCNHGDGKSLADVLDAKEDFLTNKMRNSSQNIRYFLDKTSE